MPKGKGKTKQKKKSVGEEKTEKLLEYELITIEENFKEELNQNTRILSVKENQNIFQEFQEKYDSILRGKAEIDEWLSYVNCDHIPKACIPSSIRNFFYKHLYMNQEIMAESYNWLLNIDERSILTQDIDAPNLTKSSFLKNRDIDIGCQYEVLVKDDLELLRRMCEVISLKSKEHPINIIEDIMSLELECKQLMKDFFDEYTYRILCFQDATLEYINAHIDHYYFSSNDFQIYIWARKDFEMTFDHDAPPHVLVAVKNIDLFVEIPQSIIKANRVLRCLHLSYDHYSNLTRSFKVIKHPESNSLDQNDLIAILTNEWNILRNIQKDVWKRMKAQRIAYEEYIKEQELEKEASKNKKDKTDDKKDDKKAKKPKAKPKKDKKWPKEPSVITANTLPVVHPDFMIEEDRIHQSFLAHTDPVQYQLEALEINLRNYELKGGIFEIFMVTKPKTTVFSNRIMTWHYKNSRLQYEVIKCERSEENVEKLYQVSFILPEQFIRWKLPLICQWENAQKINYDTFHEEPNKHYEKMKKICVLNDFQVNKLLSRDEKYDIARHAIPRTISSFKYEMEKQMDNPDDDVKTIKRAVDKTVKTDDELDSELVAFKWKNPERLFPVIRPYQKLQLLQNDGAVVSDEDEENGPKALFSEVVDELELYNSKLSPIFPDVNDEVENAEKKHLMSEIFGPRRTSVGGSMRTTFRDTDHGEKKSKLHRRSTRHSMKFVEQEFIEEEECMEEEDEMDLEAKWTTKHIFGTNFDPTTRKLTVKTDRLGVFAWAFDRYIQFPFKKWRLEKDKREKEEAVTFFLETQFLFVYIWITSSGYKGTVSMWLEDQGKYKTLLKFDKIGNFQQLKELFSENYFNIFPEDDAFWYVQDKESFSVKHTALENHTYDCMAYTCTSISYDYSVWNFLSSRRIIILNIKCDDDQYTLKITPENVLIVEIRELCNLLETVDLEYTPTWKNIDFTPDLLSLINSYYSYLPKVNDHKLFVNLASLLKGVRFLSYS